MINNYLNFLFEKDKELISKLVKDADWQDIRKSLLGQWSNNPEWCCKQLRDYLGDISSTSTDKLRIVMNYLTGTGFRTGTIKHQCIQDLRDEISKEMKKRK